MHNIRDSFLTFGAPFIIDDAEINKLIDCLRSGWLRTGTRVKRFEEMFRERVGAKRAVAVNLCTAGLHLSLLAAGIGPGDEVPRCVIGLQSWAA